MNLCASLVWLFYLLLFPHPRALKSFHLFIPRRYLVEAKIYSMPLKVTGLAGEEEEEEKDSMV